MAIVYMPTVQELHNLINDWKYELEDFGNGYVLYVPGGGYMRDHHGHTLLFPTIRSMLIYAGADSDLSRDGLQAMLDGSKS